MNTKYIKNNPFSSHLFSTTWIKHFGKQKPALSNDAIQGIGFIKHAYLPYYYNIGKTNTKGISYTSKDDTQGFLRKKVLLIYDVPGYFDIEIHNLPKKILLNKVKQYPGFLINLENYATIEQFMGIFSKRTRNKFNKCKRRLNLSFAIKYKVYYGEITNDQYENIFNNFRRLLEKRFDDKGITNNNLESEEWNFYHEVSLPMIREKKAALSVIYENDNPIAITLNFIGDGILFEAITVFDISYHKFNLGYVHTMYLIEWCLKSDLKIFDFSKGYFEYKVNWSNHRYPFYYHIIHDTSHIPSCIIAFSIRHFFKLKQKLRDFEINKLLHKLTFIINKRKEMKLVNDGYTFNIINEIPNTDNLLLIEHNSEAFETLKSHIISFLFLYDGHMKNVKVYFQPSNKAYFIQLKDKMAEMRKQLLK